MARADRLHAYGAADAAADLVARTCVIPSSISTSHVHRAVRMDVRRWYRAFTGSEWNGNLDDLDRARQRARVRLGRPGDGRPRGDPAPAARQPGRAAHHRDEDRRADIGTADHLNTCISPRGLIVVCFFALLGNVGPPLGLIVGCCVLLLLLQFPRGLIVV